MIAKTYYSTFISLLCLKGIFAFQTSTFLQQPLSPKTTFLQASSTSPATIEEIKPSSKVIKDESKDTSIKSEIDFDTLLQTRRTINSFLPDLPSDWETHLQTAIQSAISAPNHKRTEPWKFHLLGPKTIQKVCELNAQIVSDKKGEAAGEKKLKRWLQMPGWLVVTCTSSEENDTMEEPAGLAREDYAAVCCAVQNLCLSLHNAEMGTKWTTGPVNFDPRFNEIVGLEKDEYVVGTIWFGTPEKKPEAPKKKKNLEEVLVKHD